MKKRYSSSVWKTFMVGATAVMAAGPAFAADQHVSVVDYPPLGVYTAPYVLDPADTLTIDADGHIIGSFDAVYLGPTTFYGVTVSGDYPETITNDGQILMSVTDRNGNAGSALSVYGINIDGTLTNGAIVNNGTLSSVVDSTNAEGVGVGAEAYGINVERDLANSTITNNLAGTITASATGRSGNVAAYGIRVGGGMSATDTDASAEIVNNGTITATADGYSSDAVASGINVEGSMSAEGAGASAVIYNSGSIDAIANAEYSAEAYGINVMGDLAANGDSSMATITNGEGGTITASATSYGGGYSSSPANANAYGIYVDGDMTAGGDSASASISNTGTINANATSYSGGEGYSPANAYGIIIGGAMTASGDSASASISNTGTINANATSYGGGYSSSPANANAYGIGVRGSMQVLAGGQSASIVNEGTISAEATVDGVGTAEAYGIRIGDLRVSTSGIDDGDGGTLNSGSVFIDNSNLITAAANVTSGEGYAVGISAGNLTTEDYGLSAYITNSGTIDSTATAGYVDNSGPAYATAFGIQVGDVNATSEGGAAYIENSGIITVTATASGNALAEGQAYAYGIAAGSLTGNASISNSGTITVSASDFAPSAHAEAYGIAVSNVLDSGTVGARIVNSGTINVTAAAADGEGYGSATAAGIAVGHLDRDRSPVGGDLNTYSSITNSGDITVTLNATSGEGAGIGVNGIVNGLIENSGTITLVNSPGAGIYVNELNGSIVNDTTGIITAIDTPYSYSIYAGSGTGLVSNSGELHGNIYLGDTISLANTGLLYLPATASGHVGGDYTQNNGGMFKIDVNGEGSGQYGNLTVGGTATLEDNAKIRVNVNPVNTLAGGNTLYGVINASTSSTTLISGPTYNITDNSVKYQFKPVEISVGNHVGYEGDQIASDRLDLQVTDTGMDNYKVAVQKGGLSGATGLAGVLDGFYENGAPKLADGTTPNPYFDELLYDLGSLGTPGEVAAGISKLQPLLSGGASLANLNALHGFDRVIQSRLAGSGLSYGDRTVGDSSAWIKPYGSWSRQNDRNGTIGYDADTYGIAVGADTKVASAFKVGAALAYSSSDVDSKSSFAPQTADIDTYQVALYGSYKLNDTTDINFQGDIGKSNYDGRRHINIGMVNYNANSSFDSLNYHIGAGLNHDIKISDTTVFTPSFRADYTRVAADSYTETGAGPFNLNVASQTVSELIFAVDGKLSHALNSNAIVTGNLGLGWDAIGDDAAITSSFVDGGSSFVTSGIDPSRLMLRGGLGMVYSMTNKVDIVARYDLDAREDFTNQTGSIKLEMKF